MPLGNVIKIKALAERRNSKMPYSDAIKIHIAPSNLLLFDGADWLHEIITEEAGQTSIYKVSSRLKNKKGNPL